MDWISNHPAFDASFYTHLMHIGIHTGVDIAGRTLPIPKPVEARTYCPPYLMIECDPSKKQHSQWHTVEGDGPAIPLTNAL